MKTFIWLLCLLIGSQIHASHLIGGYIQARFTGNLQYEITVTVYANGASNQSASSDDALSLCFGDGATQPVIRLSRRFTNDRTISINTYRVVHTYAGPGNYTLSTQLSNRSVTRNSSGSSEQEPMTLTTTFSTINGANQTPILLFPETGFQATTNQRLDFPLKATDTEGDSLVYRLARPLTNNADNACAARPLAAYQYPNDVTRRGTFKLDSRTGNLTWDAPVEPGNYSVALTVSEYRNGILVSQTLLELSLTVIDRPGTPGVIPPYEPALEGGVVTALPDYRDEEITLTVFPNPVDDRLQIVVQTSNGPNAISGRSRTNAARHHVWPTGPSARAGCQHGQPDAGYLRGSCQRWRSDTGAESDEAISYSNCFHVPFTQLYLSVLGSAFQKYLFTSTANDGCM